MTRHEVLEQACDQCMKELYEYAVPHVTWEQFKKECEEYSIRYKEWESKSNNEWKDKSITECIGPKPYEFYYLPKEILDNICNSYVYAYKLNAKQELLDTICVLKNYCKEPIVDKYIEGELREDGTRWPGHRGYDHPDNLAVQVNDILNNKHPETELVINKFFEFLDMAGNFFNWNRELNSFNVTVYLGPSPNSNREAVIKNWKKYRNQDIEINETEIEKNYYGEEIDD